MRISLRRPTSSTITPRQSPSSSARSSRQSRISSPWSPAVVKAAPHDPLSRRRRSRELPPRQTAEHPLPWPVPDLHLLPAVLSLRRLDQEQSRPVFDVWSL